MPGSLRLVAHHRRVMTAYGVFELGLQGANRVDVRIKTLASLRVAQLIGCPF